MDSYIKLMKAKTTRIWVGENKYIHALNYWFYKWFTNSYRNFLLENFREVGGNENDRHNNLYNTRKAFT